MNPRGDYGSIRDRDGRLWYHVFGAEVMRHPCEVRGPLVAWVIFTNIGPRHDGYFWSLS